jgi:hypothetical protein
MGNSIEMAASLILSLEQSVKIGSFEWDDGIHVITTANQSPAPD